MFNMMWTSWILSFLSSVMAVVAVASLFALGPALVNQQVLVYVCIHAWTSRRPPLLTLEEQNANNTRFYQFKYRAIN
jgi:hypothetical protein